MVHSFSICLFSNISFTIRLYSFQPPTAGFQRWDGGTYIPRLNLYWMTRIEWVYKVMGVNLGNWIRVPYRLPKVFPQKKKTNLYVFLQRYFLACWEWASHWWPHQLLLSGRKTIRDIVYIYSFRLVKNPILISCI